MPTVSADSIWKDGEAEIVHYSTTRPGSRKACESTIEIRKHSGPAYSRGAEEGGDDKQGPEGGSVELRLLWMIFTSVKPAGVDSSKARATLVFQTSFQPMAEIWDQGQLGRQVVPIAGEVFYDGLPVWLRGFDLTRPTDFYVSMRPTQLAGDSTKAKSVAARIQILGPAGRPSVTSHGGLEVDVSHAGKMDKMWFHPGPGHPLLVWERADSTTLTFQKLERKPVD